MVECSGRVRSGASPPVALRVPHMLLLTGLVPIFALMVVFMSSSKPAHSSDRVLVIGPVENAFAQAFATLGVSVQSSPRLEGRSTPDFAGFAAVAICAADRKNPRAISETVANRLQDYVRAGGRALVEFGAGDVFGVRTGEIPVFARHERIAVSKVLGGSKELPVGTLLDEQYSYVLPVTSLPENASRMLDYGEFVGTYKVRPIPTRYYEFWVDLGAETVISSATQRYGGTNPHYCPDTVELLLGAGKTDMKSVGVYSGDWSRTQTATFSFSPQKARYVLFRCTRDDSGPGQYWFFAGEITVNAPDGTNVALRKKTRVLTPVFEQDWQQGKLTDGVIDGIYSDGHSIMLGAVGADFATPKWPALVSVPYGRGTALVLTTKVSDWAENHYRPSAKWDAAIRGICLELLPKSLRKRAADGYVPISANTEPRRWAQPEDRIRLVVKTSTAAQVSAECSGLTIGRFRRTTPGEWTASVSGAPGDYVISVKAQADGFSNSRQVKLLLADRKSAYERAVRRNMSWFLDSGIMPKRDGSAGVHSTLFIPSPKDGPSEDLPGPIRTDNLAMVIDAFVKFAGVSGDSAWMDRARKLGDMLVGVQRQDLSKADYGSFPWILAADGKVVDGHIWFHDNESRVAVGLLNLYVHSKDPGYLRAALRCLELAMDVAREDYTIGNHSVSPDMLNNMGRAAYRELANYTLYHYDIMRWHWAYAATGDAEFLKAASTVARLYNSNWSGWIGNHVWAIGPYAISLLGDSLLPPAIEAHARESLKKPDLANYGTSLMRGKGEYSLLYRNDSSINTDSEPLADLLYSAPGELRRAWFAYKASGSRSAFRLYTTLADFLVRIQLEDASPHADGCWVRGFDVDLWEDFGAPYDPNYGPYHAYSGWMNSMISEGLAFFVLDTDPFTLHRDLWKDAGPLVAESRQSRPPDKVSYHNLALGAAYTLDPARPDGKPGVLTDGVIDGAISDGQSVSWKMPPMDQVFTGTVTLDLGREESIAMVGARMGTLKSDYNADSVVIEVGTSEDDLQLVATVQAGPTVTWSVWKQFEPVRGRFVRLKFIKSRFKDSQDRLAVGEITIHPASQP